MSSPFSFAIADNGEHGLDLYIVRFHYRVVFVVFGGQNVALGEKGVQLLVERAVFFFAELADPAVARHHGEVFHGVRFGVDMHKALLLPIEKGLLYRFYVGKQAHGHRFHVVVGVGDRQIQTRYVYFKVHIGCARHVFG